MKCIYCGATIPDGELYCPSCGTEVQIVPDYNPLEDVLAKQVKGSIDGSTRPLDFYDNAEFKQTVDRDTQSRRRELSRGERDNHKNSRREAEERARQQEERRRQQIVRKRARAKKRRLRAIIIMLITLVLLVTIGVMYYNNSYGGLIRKGNTALGQKEYTRATNYYNKAVSRDKTKAEAYTGLADVFAEQGDNDSAEVVFSDVIDEQPSNVNIYKACIQFYISTDQVDKIPILLDNCDDDDVIEQLKTFDTGVSEFSLDEGTYDDVQEVSLTSDGSKIYYTTDETNPSADSTPYTAPIQLAEGTTVVKAVSFNENDIPSMIVSKTYTIDIPVADAPAVSPSTGQHTVGTLIRINVPEGYTAYYTLDGSDPSAASILYSDPVSMPDGQTIFKAILVNGAGKTTQITTRTYLTNE